MTIWAHDDGKTPLIGIKTGRYLGVKPDNLPKLSRLNITRVARKTRTSPYMGHVNEAQFCGRIRSNLGRPGSYLELTT